MPLSPEDLRELRRLHVRLGRRVDSLFAGEYRSAVRGRGMEFEEVRPYIPGDDVRYLDWNVTARTGEPFVKIFREERQNTLVLAVDVSGSTRVGTGGLDGRTDRRLQMARVAGGLAYAAIHNRDRVGLLTFSDRPEAYLPPRPTRNHAWAVIQAVFESTGKHLGTDLTAAIAHLSRVQRRRAVIVLVSDFLDDGPWQKALSTLAGRHEVHAIVVHDPLDAGVKGLGLLQIVDSETGQMYTVDGASFGITVAQRVDAIRRCGARTLSLSTKDDALLALHQHFQKVGGKP